MAKQTFKTALNVAKFPFRHTKAPSGVLAPKSDVSGRVSVQAVGKADNLDFNIIEICFAQNVFPTAKGYISCGYVSAIAAYTPP